MESTVVVLQKPQHAFKFYYPKSRHLNASVKSLQVAAALSSHFMRIQRTIVSFSLGSKCIKHNPSATINSDYNNK